MVFKLEIVKNKMDDQFVTELFKLLKERAKINNNSSYTSQLIKNPDLLAKKIGEESSELIIDFIKNNKTGIINESADLLYHLLVVWISIGISIVIIISIIIRIWLCHGVRNLRRLHRDRHLFFLKARARARVCVCA